MQFKHPEILYALFLLLIPIIVHLFQLRKFQKESFTNVAFLKKVTLQTRKSSQIKKWITLLTRMLLLACVIVAFAQPFTSKNNTFNTTPETVIYLDNSFSMQAKGENGELLKRAVQELIENLDPNEPISLVTNTEVFKNTTLKSIQNDLLQMEYAPNQLPYDAAVLKSSKLFSNTANLNRNLVFISDFQEQDKAFGVHLDSLYNMHLVQLKPVNTQNIAIDSLSVNNATTTNTTLHVFLKSSEGVSRNVPISLFDGEKLLAKTTVNLTDQAIGEFRLTEKSISNGQIVIDDTSLQFDNTLYFNIDEPSAINVLTIQEDTSSSYLERLFASNEFQLTTTSLNQLNYSAIEKQQLIVLNELGSIPGSLANSLTTFMKQGGYVVIIPNLTSETANYNALLGLYGIQLQNAVTTEKRVTRINYSHPIYKNVFEKQESNFQYPKVNTFFPIQSASGPNVLGFEDGKPFLVTNNQIALFTAALNTGNSNFSEYDLIVPTFYNLARQSLQKAQLYYTIGIENSFDVPVNLEQDGVLSLENENGNMIPMQQYFNDKVTITTTDLPEIAGVYSIKNKTTTITNVSFNYNRQESDLNYQDLSLLKNINISNSVSDIFETIKSDTKINALWKWFIIFALAFIIIEMLILKYFK
ncbi:BatA domain-containing protein [Bizionia sp.]|uniref:BatA domain-containing protein n=1 Tax=Bizionia sp. TaxID=1954480 RepID=UPI003A8D3474